MKSREKELKYLIYLKSELIRQTKKRNKTTPTGNKYDQWIQKSKERCKIASFFC